MIGRHTEVTTVIMQERIVLVLPKMVAKVIDTVILMDVMQSIILLESLGSIL